MSTKQAKERTRTGPRRRPRQSRSRELVKAVREAGRLLLAEEGPEKLTTTRIAERAGVSVGSLYQYFENKDAILKAIYEEANEESLTDIGRLVDALLDMDPKERVRVGVEYAAQHHRRLLDLDSDYYREHHVEHRMNDAIDEIPEIDVDAFGHRGVALARKLLEAESEEVRSAIHPDHAAFLLGRGVSAILRAALEDSPDRLRDPSFIEEVVTMMIRYIYPGAPREEDG